MKRRIAALLIVLILLVCVIKPANVMAITEEVKKNLSTLVEKLEIEGFKQGHEKKIQKDYIVSDIEYSVSVDFIESLNSLRFIMELKGDEKSDGKLFMDYNLSDYSAWIFFVTIGYNVYGADNKIDKKTASVENVDLKWSGMGGAAVSSRTKTLLDAFARLSLYLYDSLLYEMLGMGLGDIGFEKFESHISTNTETEKQETISETTVTISETNVVLDLNGEKYVNLYLEDADGLVFWESSDRSVAIANNGLVIGVNPGKAIITATYKGQEYTCEVTVKDSGKATNTKTYPAEDKKISTYKEVTMIPAKIYNTYASENGLGGRHFYINGTVKAVYNSWEELGEALNIKTDNIIQASKIILLGSPKGDVIIADTYSEMVNQYLTILGDNKAVVKSLKDKYGRFKAYSKYPEQNESVKILVTYSGYSTLFDLPICYYGINSFLNR